MTPAAAAGHAPTSWARRVGARWKSKKKGCHTSRRSSLGRTCPIWPNFDLQQLQQLQGSTYSSLTRTAGQICPTFLTNINTLYTFDYPATNTYQQQQYWYYWHIKLAASSWEVSSTSICIFSIRTDTALQLNFWSVLIISFWEWSELSRNLVLVSTRRDIGMQAMYGALLCIRKETSSHLWTASRILSRTRWSVSFHWEQKFVQQSKSNERYDEFV